MCLLDSFSVLTAYQPVFRELLQNSDDARSSAVEIRFETASYLRPKGEGGESNTVEKLPDLICTPVRDFREFHLVLSLMTL